MYILFMLVLLFSSYHNIHLLYFVPFSGRATLQACVRGVTDKPALLPPLENRTPHKHGI